VLRCLLRRKPPKGDAAVQRYIDRVESARALTLTNHTHALLDEQLGRITALSNDGELDALRLQSLDLSIRQLLDIQGGCERIKNTPMPRGYGFIAERLVTYYAVLFPLGVVHDLGYATIPINLLVCLSFALISEAGRVLEDPFTMFFNGLPLTALCRTIEANLLDQLGGEEPVVIPGPVKGILY
jgi:putative membrane protein